MTEKEAAEWSQKKEDHVMELQKEQLKIMRKQLFYSRVTAVTGIVLALVIAVALITVTPKLNQVLSNLQEISWSLNEEDVHKMVQNINQLAETSQTSVEEATEKLNQVDLESLNESIQDLNSIISPLARLLGKE